MNITEILKSNLTPEQYSAVIDESKNILCLACAGSGKSRTLAYKIAYLVSRGVNPESIVAFTFTEKAAESIKRRVAEALHKFVELVEAQGGDGSYILNPEKFPKAKYVVPVLAKDNGYVTRIDALAIGHASMYLGGGRAKMDDTIDHSVGIVLNKKVGDSVAKGDILAYIHANKEDVSLESKCVFDAYQIGDTRIIPKLILKVVK